MVDAFAPDPLPKTAARFDPPSKPASTPPASIPGGPVPGTPTADVLTPGAPGVTATSAAATGSRRDSDPVPADQPRGELLRADLLRADLLRAIVAALLPRLRREQFETWFRSLQLVRCDARDVELSVTSQFVRDWLQKNFAATLAEAATVAIAAHEGSDPALRRRLVLSVRPEDGWDCLSLVPMDSSAAAEPRPSPTGPMASEVERVLGRARDRATEPLVADGRGADGRPVDSRSSDPRSEERSAGLRQPRSSQLNPNYTFEKFVMGPCNRLAHAASLAIGENPGCAYNPLFLHGNVGLGKSHLLQAICFTVMQRDPRARVLYLNCEDFTNTFIKAIHSGDLEAFRQFHRNVDVLVIDDVQFLANKDKTQEEFFYTFNALYDAQKQIVLSSDRSPAEIPTIEDRLVSRFKWGLVAEVEAPCLDTRVAIVRRKAKGRGFDLDDETALYIANRISSNIRELEGAVIKVVGIAAITERPITVQLAEEALRGVAVRQSQVGADEIMGLITSEFAISARELTGKGRTQAVSLPRQIAMYQLREHTELSLEDIGRLFGNRDHTTVLYAVTKIRERRQTDRIFKEMLDGLSNRLMTRSFR